MKRKVLVLFMTGVMVLSTSGCGAGTAGNTAEVKVSESPAEVTEAASTVASTESVGEASAEGSDTGTEAISEASDELLKEIAEENAPDIDISGCDTFTQIVDKKLTNGMGYANESIGDTTLPK